MYQKTQKHQKFSDYFFLHFGSKLNKENRWVLLAEMIPWGKTEEKYAKAFKKSWKGQRALSV